MLREAFGRQGLLVVMLGGGDLYAISEQQRDAPQGAKPYHGIDDAADKCALSAEDPCHDIKLKQSDATPVDAADDQQGKG